MMMSQYLEELEQEPFDVSEFIERLTWRTNNEQLGTSDDEFDSDLLQETFTQTIKDLTILQERQQRKCEKLEEELKDEQKLHSKSVQSLQNKHNVSVEWFHELDEKINSVAGKIIHLGEQLENVNTPRQRVKSAQKLLSYMTEFLVPGPIVNDLFSDNSKLYEAADVIQKLYTIGQDLPAEKFADAKKKIEIKYGEIEMRLIEEFARAQKMENIDEMKKIASIVYQFKGHSQCVDAYIEQSQMTTGGKDIFVGIVPMCRHHYSVIKQVFTSPDDVMTKFILNIYQLKINQFAQTKLDDRRNEDKYLKTLFELYSRTVKLSQELQEFNKSTDEFDILSKSTQNIFSQHLNRYIETEVKVLDSKCSLELKKYYEGKSHQKKKAERFQDFKRDVQTLIGTRANVNIAQIDDYGGETFLSEELAINLLQESKIAFKRCRLLSEENDLPKNVSRLADILLQYLMQEHVDYAINLGLNAIPIAESKTAPQIYFFDVVQKSNTIVHLLEKIYSASIVPCVMSTSYFSECTKNKRQVLDTIEIKLDTGMDRSLAAIISWVRLFLQGEQKKTDFKPDTDVDTVASSACLNVLQQIKPYLTQLQRCLDGENLNATMTEFGCRFHRVIFDHLQQFQFNTAGAMCAICDVNEYRKLVRTFKSELVSQLFDILHALCNLLLVKRENLPEVCGGETLSSLDKSVVLNFIQLRSDYKAIKLSNALKGIITDRI